MSDTQPTSSYQLAPAYAGQTFAHEDYGTAITAENLTDEAAEFLIGHGQAHAFLKNGKPLTPAAIAKLTGKAEAEDEADAQKEEPTQITSVNALVPEADLKAEQAAHQATSKQLETAQHELAAEKADHTTATAALQSEKQAHAATTAARDELNTQLSQANETIAGLHTAKAKKAPAATTAGTDSTSSDGKGTN